MLHLNSYYSYLLADEWIRKRRGWAYSEDEPPVVISSLFLFLVNNFSLRKKTDFYFQAWSCGAQSWDHGNPVAIMEKISSRLGNRSPWSGHSIYFHLSRLCIVSRSFPSTLNILYPPHTNNQQRYLRQQHSDGLIYPSDLSITLTHR